MSVGPEYAEEIDYNYINKKEKVTPQDTKPVNLPVDFSRAHFMRVAPVTYQFIRCGSLRCRCQFMTRIPAEWEKQETEHQEREGVGAKFYTFKEKAKATAGNAYHSAGEFFQNTFCSGCRKPKLFCVCNRKPSA